MKMDEEEGITGMSLNAPGSEGITLATSPRDKVTALHVIYSPLHILPVWSWIEYSTNVLYLS